VAARDEDEDALVVLRAEGYPADLVRPFMRLPLDAPLPSTHTARTGEALFLVGEDEWNARFQPRGAIIRVVVGEGAWAALPLRAGDRLLGVWALSYMVRGPFDAAEREFLLALAGQAALALERARLRDEEREARERLALAQTAARIGTFDWDVPSGRVTWTTETERLFGLAPGTFPGTYDAWRPLMHPNDADQAERLLFEAAARGDREVDLAFRVRRRPDGVVRWIEGRALLTYAPDGTLARVVGTNVDVTQRRTAERRAAWLQELATLLSGAVATDDVARVVLEHGRAATGAGGAIVMLRSADAPDELEQVAVAGMPDHLLRAWVRVALDADVPTSHAVRTGAAVWAESRAALSVQFPEPLVADYVREAGYEAWVTLPLTVDDRVLGAVIFGFAEERTFEDDERRFLLALVRQCGLALERARLFEAERHARAAAEAANRAKSEFLAIMSHELRTPLNAIGGYAELLEMGLRGPVTDAQRSDLGRIQQSQRHLLGLINEVLNYARVESGTVAYALRDVPVAAVLASVEPLVRPQLEAKGLTLHVIAIPPGLAVRADEDKLRQILLNLLSNAVKFTERGGHVTLDAEADHDAGRVRLRVVDTGIGIPLDKQELIFDPFVQVNASLTRSQEGVGLGLAISRDLARGMGGELMVESTPGEGSTFTLSMPPADDAPSD
jgi:PAS domain S-box-containing protein